MPRKKVVRKKKAAERREGPLIILTKSELEKLREESLSKRVLIPLFRKMGYEDVRYTGGTKEQGKDITMWTERDGRRVPCAVVVKARRITGRATDQDAFIQAGQSLGSTVFDRRTNQSVRVDRCIVVTSHEIDKHGDYAIEPLLDGFNIRERVQVIDGQELLNLLKQYRSVPAVLGDIAETYDSLIPLDPNYGIELTYSPTGEKRIGFAAKSPDASPLPLNLTLKFPPTKRGRAKLAEVRSHFERGTPLSLGAEYIEELTFPAIMEAFFPPDQQYALELGPAEADPIPMAVTFVPETGDDFTLHFVELKVERAGTREMVLSNRHQPIGIHVELVITDHRVTFTCAPRPGTTTIEEYGDLLHFLRCRHKGGTLIVRHRGTQKDVIRAPLPASQADVPEEMVDIVRRVIRLGRTLEVVLKVPERPFFTEGDLRQIEAIEDVVTSGEAGVTFLKFSPPDALTSDWPPTSPIMLRQPDYRVTLLDNDISLGPIGIRFSKYIAERASDGDIELHSADGGVLHFKRWTKSG